MLTAGQILYDSHYIRVIGFLFEGFLSKRQYAMVIEGLKGDGYILLCKEVSIIHLCKPLSNSRYLLYLRASRLAALIVLSSNSEYFCSSVLGGIGFLLVNIIFRTYG